MAVLTDEHDWASDTERTGAADVKRVETGTAVLADEHDSAADAERGDVDTATPADEHDGSTDVGRRDGEETALADPDEGKLGGRDTGGEISNGSWPSPELRGDGSTSDPTGS